MGDIMTRSTIERAHRDSLLVNDADLVNALVLRLGTRLVAFIVDKDRSTISRWKQPGTKLPDDASQALRLVYEIFRLLEGDESDHTIRAWFIGMNPQLDDDSPAEAIQSGRFKDALVAARAFRAGG